MKGITVTVEDELRIRFEHNEYGTICIPPDEEFKKAFGENNRITTVEGYVREEKQHTINGINFFAWIFQVESFDAE